MKRIELVFGTYNSLPIGSTDVEFEHAYERAYKPFLTTLYKYPGVSAAIYYSGILLTWLDDHHPEFLMLLNDMVKRSQIELLGGAFYEPILPLIPSGDRSGQIEMLTTYLRKRFGRRPRGIWIPELVWEPSLPANLKNCGMEYTFLDASAFDAAGLSSRYYYQAVKTEDQGKALDIWAIQSKYAPSRLGEHDRSDPALLLKRIVAGCPSDEDVVVSILDGGESLGLWNDSFGWLYDGTGWLSQFFALLSNSETGIVTTLPKEIARRPHRTERCYFGCSQTSALSDWWFSEAPKKRDLNRMIRKRTKKLIPSGSFRQIIRRYPESKNLYAKMMHVGVLVNQIRGDRYRKSAAREELWRGQSGCAYWHGKNDGIKRNSIRKAAYTALIEAEKIARERGIFKEYTSREDFDMDGLAEYLFNGNVLNIYIHTIGGAVFELDHLAASWNYLDTMGRYEEPYHEAIVPATVFDLQPKRLFVDRIAASGYSLADYLGGVGEEIDDLSTHEYEVTGYKRDHMEVGVATVWDKRLEIRKKYTLKKNVLSVTWFLKNVTTNSDISHMVFMTELNFAFASHNEEFLQIRAKKEDGEVLTLREACESQDIVSFEARDLKNAVTIDGAFDNAVELWSMPVISTWYSQSGVRSGYQSSSFMVRSPLSLRVGESMTFTARLTFRD